MGSKDEQAIETEIKEKGLTAPRITPQQIDDLIQYDTYFVDGTMTICVLTLKNGFKVTGESAAASSANFDEEIGRKIARENARNKIWPLAGFVLKTRLGMMGVTDPDHQHFPGVKILAARVCHEVNRIWCQINHDFSQPYWIDAPAWQQESAIMGVMFHMENPDAGADASHNSWWEQKRADGWVWGEVKDPEAKTHPCMVPFEDLPKDQQLKDHLFRSVVHSVLAVYGGE
jgi:hypothetical protein